MASTKKFSGALTGKMATKAAMSTAAIRATKKPTTIFVALVSYKAVEARSEIVVMRASGRVQAQRFLRAHARAIGQVPRSWSFVDVVERVEPHADGEVEHLWTVK